MCYCEEFFTLGHNIDSVNWKCVGEVETAGQEEEKIQSIRDVAFKRKTGDTTNRNCLADFFNSKMKGRSPVDFVYVHILRERRRNVDKTLCVGFVQIIRRRNRMEGFNKQVIKLHSFDAYNTSTKNCLAVYAKQKMSTKQFKKYWGHDSIPSLLWRKISIIFHARTVFCIISRQLNWIRNESHLFIIGTLPEFWSRMFGNLNDCIHLKFPDSFIHSAIQSRFRWTIHIAVYVTPTETWIPRRLHPYERTSVYCTFDFPLKKKNNIKS